MRDLLEVSRRDVGLSIYIAEEIKEPEILLDPPLLFMADGIIKT